MFAYHSYPNLKGGERSTIKAKQGDNLLIALIQPEKNQKEGL